jgi:hypothetical protein
MQPLNVIQVEVAQEEIDRKIVIYVLVCLAYAISRIKDYVILIGVDQGTYGVPGIAVIPAVGS